MSINSMGPTASNTVADSNSPRTSLGDQSEGDHNGEPYSKLIYRALKDADGHRLSLQQIYDWFIKNTSKGRDSTKGWQNSIRHNLSMNKVRPLTPNTSIIPAAGFISNQFHITIHFPGFEASKIDGCTRKKPQNLWALTQDAINRGYVESTTRYRKSNHRKATSSNFPFLGRQRSGSKGGRPQNMRRRRATQFSTSIHQRKLPQPQPSGDLASPLPTPPFGDAPHYQLGKVFNGLPPGDSLVKQEFDFSKVIGCTSSPLGDNSMFYGVAGPALSYVPLDLDHIGGWYPLSGPDNGLTGPGKL
ncbi:hypothetical protein N7526_003841 [Penicillium atrosanguineum]|nr:hypothetical protein N7526_003841 [Penicillium atrosanguineum]